MVVATNRISSSSIIRKQVDVFITYEDYTEGDACIKYNKSMASEYLKYLNKISEDFGITNDVTNVNLSRYPEVFVLEEQSIDEEKLWSHVKEAVEKLCEEIGHGLTLKNLTDDDENGSLRMCFNIYALDKWRKTFTYEGNTKFKEELW